LPLSLHSTKHIVGDIQRDYLYRISLDDCLGRTQTINYAKAAHPGFDEKVVDNMDAFNIKGLWPDRKTSTISKYWKGKPYHFAGRNESTRTGQLIFKADQGMKCKDFWQAAKDLTGSEESDYYINKPFVVLAISIYLLSVDKKKITDAVRLEQVQVMGVSGLELNKEGGDLQQLTVDIVWDQVRRMHQLRGKEI